MFFSLSPLPRTLTDGGRELTKQNIVAQLPFESRVSGQTEYNPVCASLVGAQGSDLSLIRLVKNALELAQWRTRVDTGHLAFPLGDNERNVNDEHHQQSVLQAQTRPDEL